MLNFQPLFSTNVDKIAGKAVASMRLPILEELAWDTEGGHSTQAQAILFL